MYYVWALQSRTILPALQTPTYNIAKLLSFIN